MRFRQELIAMSADIEAMFNQLAVPEEDQSVLRFVWRRTPEDRVDVYQYTAQDNKHSFPSEAEVVERNFYMVVYANQSHPYWKHVVFNWTSEFTFTRWILTVKVDIK